MARKKLFPRVRRHNSGQACCDLDGRTKYLGDHGSPESYEAYCRTLLVSRPVTELWTHADEACRRCLGPKKTYFMQERFLRLVKIGVSVDPQVRRRNFILPWTVIGTVEHDCEQALHRVFESCRLDPMNEVFAPSVSMVDWFNSTTLLTRKYEMLGFSWQESLDFLRRLNALSLI